MNRTKLGKISLIAFLILYPVAVFTPYIFGEKQTIKVYDSGLNSGRRGTNRFYTFDESAINCSSISVDKISVRETIIPKTVGGGNERTAYRFYGAYYLVGITAFMLYPLIV